MIYPLRAMDCLTAFAGCPTRPGVYPIVLEARVSVIILPMPGFIYSLVKRLWPELEHMSEQRRLMGVGDVLSFFTTAPLALVGLFWLGAVSDLNWMMRQAGWLAFFLGLILTFNWMSYFFIIEIREDRYGSADGSLASMVQWSAVLILGPSALWLSVVFSFINFVQNWRKFTSAAARWSQLRTLAMEQAANTVAYLGALEVYQNLGGVIPLPGLSFSAISIAMAAMVAYFILVVLIWLEYILYAIWAQRVLTRSHNLAPLVKFFALALGLPNLAHPFAILVAGLYIQSGFEVFLFLILGLILVAYLSRQLSWAAESNRQRSRQLEKLEHLGRDIISALPDGSALADLLKEHVPMMFPSGRIAIWLFSDGYYLLHPEGWQPEIEAIWQWVKSQKQAHAFLAKEQLPWDTSQSHHDPLVVVPILDTEEGMPIGCVYLELRSLAQPWDRRALSNLFPAALTLAAQVASALHQADIYQDTLEYQAMLQELEFAGRIQASLLPNEMPRMDGWEVAVTLLPARETSGDYFDIIPLSDGRIGILIADVADKGLGAALYMALSRTLIRTYALEYEASPDIVFFSANRRILQDARVNLFVTAFYGILDPQSGTLLYANAGHHPPLLLSPANGGAIRALTATGMPIGIDEEATWTQMSMRIEPGEMLVLYTDGIPDAENGDGAVFKERKLIEIVQANMGVSAQEMQRAILEAVQNFVGDAPQFDDITLLVIRRDWEASPESRHSPPVGPHNVPRPSFCA